MSFGFGGRGKGKDFGDELSMLNVAGLVCTVAPLFCTSTGNRGAESLAKLLAKLHA